MLIYSSLLLATNSHNSDLLSIPDAKYQIEHHSDTVKTHKMETLLHHRNWLKNHLYKIEGNPDKTNERIAIKKELAECEIAISNLMIEQSIPKEQWENQAIGNLGVGINRRNK
jgi:hypothetical protein